MDTVISLGSALFAFSTLQMYFTSRESLYPGYEANVSQVSDVFDVWCISLLVVHFGIYYAVVLMSYIYCKEAVDSLLEKLLEEVAEIDLVGNAQA